MAEIIQNFQRYIEQLEHFPIEDADALITHTHIIATLKKVILNKKDGWEISYKDLENVIHLCAVQNGLLHLKLMRDISIFCQQELETRDKLCSQVLNFIHIYKCTKNPTLINLDKIEQDVFSLLQKVFPKQNLFTFLQNTTFEALISELRNSQFLGRKALISHTRNLMHEVNGLAKDLLAAKNAITQPRQPNQAYQKEEPTCPHQEISLSTQTAIPATISGIKRASRQGRSVTKSKRPPTPYHASTSESAPTPTLEREKRSPTPRHSPAIERTEIGLQPAFTTPEPFLNSFSLSKTHSAPILGRSLSTEHPPRERPAIVPPLALWKLPSSGDNLVKHPDTPSSSTSSQNSPVTPSSAKQNKLFAKFARMSVGKGSTQNGSSKQEKVEKNRKKEKNSKWKP